MQRLFASFLCALVSLAAITPAAQAAEVRGAHLVDQAGGSALAGLVVEQPFYDISDASGVEGEAGTTAMTFTITRSGNLDIATTIHPWTQDITAKHNVDYVNIQSTNSLTFAAGETTKTVTVQIKSDLLDEPDETLRLRLANPGIGEKDIGIGTIVDSDPPAGPNTMSANDGWLNEGDSGSTPRRLTITRTGDISGSATVSYRTVQGTATQGVDYTGVTTGTATFGPGDWFAAIEVPVTGDTTIEPDETFTVELSNPTGSGASIDGRAGVITIYNDDVD